MGTPLAGDGTAANCRESGWHAMKAAPKKRSTLDWDFWYVYIYIYYIHALSLAGLGVHVSSLSEPMNAIILAQNSIHCFFFLGLARGDLSGPWLFQGYQDGGQPTPFGLSLRMASASVARVWRIVGRQRLRLRLHWLWPGGARRTSCGRRLASDAGESRGRAAGSRGKSSRRQPKKGSGRAAPSAKDHLQEEAQSHQCGQELQRGHPEAHQWTRLHVPGPGLLEASWHLDGCAQVWMETDLPSNCREEGSRRGEGHHRPRREHLVGAAILLGESGAARTSRSGRFGPVPQPHQCSCPSPSGLEVDRWIRMPARRWIWATCKCRPQLWRLGPRVGRRLLSLRSMPWGMNGGRCF